MKCACDGVLFATECGGEADKGADGGGEAPMETGEVKTGGADKAAKAAAASRQATAYLAVVGIAAVACGEGVGTEMARRALDHLLQYGGPGVRKAVPLRWPCCAPPTR